MKIVKVTWIDAEEYGEIGWNSLKSMKTYAKKPCPTMTSVGHVLYEDDNHISLISTVGEKESSSVDKIPKSFINKIEELTEKVNEKDA
tara:strand:+ start:29941 stop:30204 length:264 start_codon:yes stop_codon:yes gene_type:complete